jgi:hypothetical protein
MQYTNNNKIKFLAFICFVILYQVFGLTALAQSPPNLPLPICQTIEGEEVGACPDEDFRVSASIGSDFAEGAAVQVQTIPDAGICISHMHQSNGGWSPAPCFAGVSRPSVGTCGVIDLLDDGQFKEMSCTNALYTNTSTLSGPLFTIEGVNGNACGGSGNFQTFIYGGFANVPGARWSEFGPSRQICQIVFNGPRPDGLFGPTWVKVTVGTSIAIQGDSRSPSTSARTEVYVPINGDMRPFIDANFEADVFGLKATFTNNTLTSESSSRNLSYDWDFGDGNSSTLFEPEHLYSEAGTYSVTLTATNQDGNENMETQAIETISGLVIEISGAQSIENGQQETYNVKVGNFENSAITNFTLEMSDTEDLLVQEGIPQPAVISQIAQNDIFTSGFQMNAIATGETSLQVIGGGDLVSGDSVSKTGSLDVAVQPNLTLLLSAPFVQASGEEVSITLSITNEQDIRVTGIRVESLLTLPNELVEFVSGPIDTLGRNATTNLVSLDPGESTQITWTYLTKGIGIVDLQASVAFDSISDIGRALQSVKSKFAIEVAAIELSNLRLQPGRPIPGEFAYIRGTLTNIGNFDVKDIDFELVDEESNEPTPEFKHIESIIEGLDTNVMPRIALLKPEQSQDFIIPVGMILDVDDASRYTLPLTYSGIAILDPEDEDKNVDVTTDEILRDDIDRTEYWEDLLSEYYALMVNGVISIFDEIDEFGDSSLLGGITVGSAEGVINVLEEMGNGALSVVDFLGETSGDGGETLSKQADQIVNVITEYNNTTTFEQKLVDLADVEEAIAVGGVDIFANWMFDVETASREGRSRDVATLLSEPATQVVTGVGAEQAGARLFVKLLRTSLGRKLLFKLTKKFEVPNESSAASVVIKYINDLEQSFDDLPEGVPLTGQHALMAGVEGDDLAFMLDEAKRTNATFFVRPRPATAAAHAKSGYNAKPLPVKMKSVSDLDCEWLGYNCLDTGLVVIRNPDDPTDKLRSAIVDGRFGSIDEFEPGDPEIQAILKRYSAKKAEFENIQETIQKLNSVKKHKIVKNPDPANPDLELLEEVEAPGIVVKRYGRDQITTVSIDEGTGRLIFDYNGQPVYSDIDLLSVAKRDGVNVSPTLHRQILKNSSYGFDGQHHATAQTSDFPKAEFAQKVARLYLGEHSRGGEGLLIISPEGMTKGFVKSFDTISLAEAKALDAGKIKLSDYDLYGLVVKRVTYTGAQSR